MDIPARIIERTKDILRNEQGFTEHDIQRIFNKQVLLNLRQSIEEVVINAIVEIHGAGNDTLARLPVTRNGSIDFPSILVSERTEQAIFIDTIAKGLSHQIIEALKMR